MDCVGPQGVGTRRRGRPHRAAHRARARHAAVAADREPAIDLAFIDADKGGYRAYWDELVPRVRPGGVLLADNVLWSAAAWPTTTGTRTRARIREFNDRVAADDRVDVAVLPAFDGLTIALRR